MTTITKSNRDATTSDILMLISMLEPPYSSKDLDHKDPHQATYKINQRKDFATLNYKD